MDVEELLQHLKPLADECDEKVFRNCRRCSMFNDDTDHPCYKLHNSPRNLYKDILKVEQWIKQEKIT